MNANKSEQLDTLTSEVESIKRLLLFWLLKNGMSQEDVARALGVNQSTVSRIFQRSTNRPARKNSITKEITDK